MNNFNCLTNLLNYFTEPYEQNEKIFIILLNNDKYYIDFAYNYEHVYNLYFSDYNVDMVDSDWLSKNKPLKILHNFELSNNSYKNKISAIMTLMLILGVDNVRGKYFPYTYLSKSDNILIKNSMDNFKFTNLLNNINHTNNNDNDNENYSILNNTDTSNIISKFVINDFF